MRLLLIVGLAAVSAWGALAQTGPEAGPPPPVVEPTTQGTHDVGGAAATPLRNANLVRQNIPSVLEAAVADPYALPQPLTCGTLANGVVELNGALGDDLDAKTKNNSAKLGPEAVKVAANTLIPWQGVLRFVSGADARDRRVRRAIIAGSVRRAYLKGLGEARGCGAPSAPLGHAIMAPPAPPPAKASVPKRRRGRR